MPIGWNFPSNNYGTINGIGEAGIETFKGTPYRSLAREICQNSLDAKPEDREHQNLPVAIFFHCVQVDPNNIPGFPALKAAVESCLNFWTRQNNKKTIDFFKKAVSITQQRTISVLRISDFNTTGLTGSDKDYNTPWQNLVKAAGVSDKGGNSGGSFGIGKSAPFACSDLRTVFYSTRDITGLEASQGIARLVSFPSKTDKNEDSITTGIGYYGKIEKNRARPERCSLDPGFTRKIEGKIREGTDVFIVGFTNKPDWKKEVITSILEDFLISIYFELLIVQVDDINITKNALPQIMEDYKDSAPAAYSYYQVLTSPDTHIIEHNFGNLGKIELRILIQSGLNRRVFMSRSNGMKIFDQKNFPSAIEFSGICILKDESINSYFREMENPQHNAWEPERHSRPPEARKRKDELRRYIKERVLEFGRKTTVAEIDAEGVGEYLPDDATTGAGPDKGEAIVDATKDIDLSVSAFKPAQKAPEMSASNDGSPEDDGTGEPDEKGFGRSGGKNFGDDGHNFDGDGSNYGGGEGDGPGKNGIGTNPYDKGVEMPDSSQIVRRKFEINTMSVRLILIDSVTHQYRLIFTPGKTSVEGYLQFKLSGEQSNIDVNISNAVDGFTFRPLHSSKNIIYLNDIAANKKMAVEFSVDYAERISMEVSLYGYKI